MPDPVVCPECGSVLEQMTAQIERLQELIEYERGRRERCETELDRKRAQITRMTRQQDQDVLEGPRRKEANEVLEYWRKTCMPKAKTLNGDRLKNVTARLKEGFSVAELQRCAWGYAQQPYVTNVGRCEVGLPKQRFVDAELIYRSEQHVERGLSLAATFDRPAEVVEVGESAVGLTFEQHRRIAEMNVEALGLGDGKVLPGTLELDRLMDLVA